LLLELDLTPLDVIADEQRGKELAAAAAANGNSFDAGDSGPRRAKVDAAQEEPESRCFIQFHQLLLALARMRFGNRCLEFDKEVEREHEIQQKHEADAYRILAICVRAWQTRRNPPPDFVTESDHRRWRSAVAVARLWMMKSAIRTIRISNQRTWQHRQIDDVISEAMRKRREEEKRLPPPKREVPMESNGVQKGNADSANGENGMPAVRKSTVTFG
jgi:hypothetical protein